MKLKHIGDVLLATPCIAALHRSFPEAEISMLVNEGTEAMVQGHPLLKDVIVFPRTAVKQGLWGRANRELGFARKLRDRKFDMVVDLTSADRPAWLGFFSGARYRLAYNPQGKGFFGKRFFYTHIAPHPKDPNLHEVVKNLGILEHFEIHANSPVMELHPSKSDQSAAEKLLASASLGTFAVVHPTSRWLFKCWADDRFAALIDWLQEIARCPVLVTCGPDPRERQRTEAVLALCRTKPPTSLGELTLPQWAATVKRAQLFVGVDSAPMHIAASQGTPTLALFGPTGHHNWSPWAVQHELLVHDCPCSRDRQPHCDWKTTRACMLEITLEEAQKACENLLKVRTTTLSPFKP